MDIRNGANLGSSGDVNEPSLDDIFRILSDDYSRYTLTHLTTRNSVTLNQLAVVVAESLAEQHGSVESPDQINKVRIQLHHVVLPKLRRYQFLQYDAEEQQIVRDTIPPKISTLVELVQ